MSWEKKEPPVHTRQLSWERWSHPVAFPRHLGWRALCPPSGASWRVSKGRQTFRALGEALERCSDQGGHCESGLVDGHEAQLKSFTPQGWSITHLSHVRHRELPAPPNRWALLEEGARHPVEQLFFSRREIFSCATMLQPNSHLDRDPSLTYSYVHMFMHEC